MSTAAPDPTSAVTPRRLTRAHDGRPAAPVRIAHLGLGSFFRAHQAWYTERASDSRYWGIAAFAGRSAGAASGLAEQDGLYTLLVRGAEGDRPEVVSALSQVHGSLDLTAWRATFSLPDLAVVTSTVTEAGYCRDASGGLDLGDPAVAGDLDALRAGGADADAVTAPGKLVVGLLTRRNAALPGVTFVPCDNVPDNGEMVRRVVLDLAREVDPSLAGWVADRCGFVTTMVDRITPRTTDGDRGDLLEASGIWDPACVVTEPYAEWVLAGDFVAGRPAWETSGARFVEDLEPWERRKLWLLNGSHSLLAYAAPLRGALTVADAIADPVVRVWVEQWWDEAAKLLPLPAQEVASYRTALLERYSNPRIKHLLAQIAADGTQKLPIRIVPVLRAHLAAGKVAAGATRVVAAWTLHLRGHGSPVADPAAEELRSAVASASVEDALRLVLEALELDDERVHPVALAQVREMVPMADRERASSSPTPSAPGTVEDD